MTAQIITAAVVTYLTGFVVTYRAVYRWAYYNTGYQTHRYRHRSGRARGFWLGLIWPPVAVWVTLVALLDLISPGSSDG